MNIGQILMAAGGVISAIGAIVSVVIYFRPPQITPISEDNLANIRRIDSLKGDTNGI